LNYSEKFTPKLNVLADGYGVYSKPKEGIPFCALSTLTSGSKPEKSVIINRF
jgi:hypothetical protein